MEPRLTAGLSAIYNTLVIGHKLRYIRRITVQQNLATSDAHHSPNSLQCVLRKLFLGVISGRKNCSLSQRSHIPLRPQMQPTSRISRPRPAAPTPFMWKQWSFQCPQGRNTSTMNCNKTLKMMQACSAGLLVTHQSVLVAPKLSRLSITISLAPTHASTPLIYRLIEASMKEIPIPHTPGTLV
jgi:hypothetical protein